MNEALRQALEAYQARANRAGAVYSYKPEDGVQAETDGDKRTVTVRGPLDGGWFGPSAERVIREMGDAKNIHVIIDSPGGSVFEGSSLYSELRARAEDGATITTEGRSLVASAAVLPFLAGDERELVDGTMVMVHNPWAFFFAIGDAQVIEDESSKMLSALKAITKNYADIVSARTGRPLASVRSEMDKETWYSLEEAKTAGYIEALATEPQAASAAQAMAQRILANMRA